MFARFKEIQQEKQEKQIPRKVSSAIDRLFEDDEDDDPSVAHAINRSGAKYKDNEHDKYDKHDKYDEDDDVIPLSKVLLKRKSAEPEVEKRRAPAWNEPFEEVRPNFDNGSNWAENAPLYLSDRTQEPVVQVPASIAKFLRPYQAEGVKFLHNLYSLDSGGILADDMGLGKTIQVVAFLAALFGKTGTIKDRSSRSFLQNNKGRKRALIVSPASVLYNWERELQTWGWFDIGIVHGSGTELAIKKMGNEKFELVLTTYEMCTKEFSPIQWDVIVVDEAHKLKNPKSKTARAFMEFKFGCRIALTGTPLSNKLEEMWSLLNWCNQNCLETLSGFKAFYCKPILNGQKFDATSSEVAEGRDLASRLKQYVDTVMLRRTKKIIANELPRKEDRVVFCPLSPMQREVYQRLLDSEDFRLVIEKDNLCSCKSGLTQYKCCFGMNSLGEPVDKLILKGLSALRSISNHVALLFPSQEDDEAQYERKAKLTKIMFPKDWKMKKSNFLEYSNIENCGKWTILRGMLLEWRRERKKVLLFSYSARLLNMLEKLMISENWEFKRLDGSTSVPDRLPMCDEFNKSESIFVFLISTRAGGLGLNLVSSNTVVIFDPSWNPASDLQAQDRAFRIGQKKDVKVYRLIAAGSIEENVYGRQIYKQQLSNIATEASHERRLFNGVQGDKHNKGDLFGYKNLYTLHNNSDVQTKALISRNEIAETMFGVNEDDGTDDEGDASALHQLRDYSDDEAKFQPQGEDDGLGLKRLAARLFEPKESTVRRAKGESSRARDPIGAILDECGVNYSHANTDFIGHSKTEEALAKVAKKVAKDNPDQPAWLSGSDFTNNLEGVPMRMHIHCVIGHTPIWEQNRQFEEMWKVLRFPSAYEFALWLVQESTNTERNKVLVKYRKLMFS